MYVVRTYSQTKTFITDCSGSALLLRLIFIQLSPITSCFSPFYVLFHFIYQHWQAVLTELFMACDRLLLTHLWF